jgi:hypothetical protein
MLKAVVLTVAVAGLCGMAAATAYDHRVGFNVLGIFGLMAMLRVGGSDSFFLPNVLLISAAALYVSAFSVLVANEFGAVSAALVTLARWTFIVSLGLLVFGRIRAHLVIAHAENPHSQEVRQ